MAISGAVGQSLPSVRVRESRGRGRLAGRRQELRSEPPLISELVTLFIRRGRANEVLSRSAPSRS